MKRNRPKRTEPIRDPKVILRLVANVDQLACGCWIWQGYTDRKGYGQIKIDGQAFWAHRVAYAEFRGTIPDGLTIHHTCGTPGCINPDHLELMTLQENSAESQRRRRSKKVDSFGPGRSR